MLSWIKQSLNPTPPPAAILQTATKVQLPKLKTVSTAKQPKTKEKKEDNQPTFRVCKLIMVTANNNNKFYEMREQADGTFIATYGRVGNNGATATYPMTQWDKKINEKTRKGYTDQTHLFASKTTVENEIQIDNEAVNEIINDLMRFAKKSIQYNYNVTAEQVTRKQVNEAQAILDNLVSRVKSGMRGRYFNDKLLTLFQIIPRRMTNVKNHLISSPKSSADLKAINDMLAKEQATLDVMRGQVEINERQQNQNDQNQHAPKKLDLLEAMGLQMELLDDKKLIKSIKKMMGTNANKFKRAYKICNVRTQKTFDQHLQQCKNKKTELFWHGSRNENWMSILKTGLVLRPANAVINGKMFGYGLYFADKFQKSLNYTSLRGSYWSGGTQNKGYLALYDVHVGEQLKIKKHQSWCTSLNAEQLKTKGKQYNSVFAKGGVDLINNEYIVYNQSQCTVRYIVEVG